MKQCRRLWYNEREMTDMNKDILADEIYNRYGAITRARGCFLYTKKTVRLTDMFREGGAAILGWGGGSAFTMLKNTLNRGITGTFRTEFHPQLIRAVSLLLDNQKNTRTLRVFRSLSALRAECGEDVAVYTPFDPDNTDYSTKDAVAVVPPLPWVSPSYALLVGGAVGRVAVVDTCADGGGNVPRDIRRYQGAGRMERAGLFLV